MTCRGDRVLAVIVVARLFVLAVSLGNIPVQTLAAAGALQDTGQDMCVSRVVDLLTPVSIDFPFLLPAATRRQKLL